MSLPLHPPASFAGSAGIDPALNRLRILNAAATYINDESGYSIACAGILGCDPLIVDRSVVSIARQVKRASVPSASRS